MKLDDHSTNGSVSTMAGETGPLRTAVEPMDAGRSSKGKTTKKTKGKSGKKNGVVEERADLVPIVVAAPADGAGRQPEESILEDEPVAEGIDGRGDPTSVENGLALSTEEPEDPEGPSPAPSSIGRRRRSKLGLITAGVLVVGLAVALILSLLALSNQNAQASARTSALAAARSYAGQLASYNYRDLNRGFAALAAESTPSFRRSFTESSNALKTTLTKYKATADATVVSAGLVSSSPSQAVALVFLTQKIANSTQAKPTTDRSQVQITLVKSGGRWLINQVTLL